MREYMGWDMSCDPPCITETFGMKACQSHAAICDTRGNLLFYSNGQTVWNKQHKIMPNGTGLYACLSGKQNAVIVPFNSDSSLYYLITADSFRDSLQRGTRLDESCYLEDYPDYLQLHLHIVDTKANHGQGAVVLKNKPIYAHTDHVAAVKHANTRDTWLVFLDGLRDRYTALLLTDCGIMDTVVSELGVGFKNPYLASNAEIKFNVKGNLFCHSALVYVGKTVLGKFDPATGKVVDRLTFDKISYTSAISLDSKSLYLNDFNRIHEYDISSFDSSSIMTSGRVLPKMGNIIGLQNMPNGKLMVPIWDYFGYVKDTIDSPTYLKCYTLTPRPESTLIDSFVHRKQIKFFRSELSKPPNYIQNYFDPDFVEYEKSTVVIQHSRVCMGGTTQLKVKNLPPFTPYHWELYENGKAVGTLSNVDSLSHTFSHAGEHEARLVLEFSCHPDTIKQKLVTVDTIPQPNLGRDTAVCSGETIPLYAPQRQVAYLWSNGATSDHIIAGAGQYTVLVSNTCGSASDTITISEAHHELTNIVTPNEDQLNDYLVVNSQYSNTIGALSIYNRWGQEVYQTNHYKNDWPHEDIGSGVYFCEFQYRSCPKVKGWVEIRK